jgi:hypothetical protein
VKVPANRPGKKEKKKKGSGAKEEKNGSGIENHLVLQP